MAGGDELVSRLALLTRAAWDESFPPPLTRRMFARLTASGALNGLVLRDAQRTDAAVHERACLLMSRVSSVARCLNALEEQGYEMILPADAAWPQGLSRLGADMPQFLFARGNQELLSGRKIAVAGSRRILQQTANCAQAVGRRLAQEKFVMVCGGANGVDDAAQRALIEAGGSLILVPARPVSELLHRYDYLRAALEDGRLLILCDTLPEELFSAAKALSRNHAIYALGEAAVVVASRRGVGGSWRGAVDCLRAGYMPVYALDCAGTDMEGNHALFELGAKKLAPDEAIITQLCGLQLQQMSCLDAF